MHLISVSPLGEAWAVRSDGVANDMVFSSGARAEAAARALGERLAADGLPTAIRIFDRTGALAGRFICAPEATARPEL
jgi:hypothetical protein